MLGAGLSKTQALLILRAKEVVDVGERGDGEGWKAIEMIVKNNVRWFIYNKTNLLDQVARGKINLSSIEAMGECNQNRKPNEEGFQYGRSSVGQRKLDIANAMRDEYTLPIPEEVIKKLDIDTRAKMAIMNVRKLVSDYFRVPEIQRRYGQKWEQMGWIADLR